MLKAAAVLLNWKRSHNLPVIVQSLKAVPAIASIHIWDNSGELNPHAFPGCRVHHSQSNVYTLGRFIAASRVDCDTVYTQDDDVLVNNVAELVELHANNQTDIVAGLTPGHYRVEARQKPWLQLGWGGVFRREWVGVLNVWRDFYGEDSLLQRKADRIFTILHGRNHPVPANVTPLRDPDGRLSESSNDALYRRPDHFQLTEAATAKALELRVMLETQ